MNSKTCSKSIGHILSHAFQTGILIAILPLAGCNEASKREKFLEHVEQEQLCGRTCEKLASMCGPVPASCRQTCYDDLSLEQRSCLQAAGSCEAASACTSVVSITQAATAR